MLGPREIVLDGADRPLRRPDTDEAADSQQSDQPGQTREGAADAEEAGPGGDVGTRGEPESGGDKKQQQPEVAEEAGAAEQARADARLLELAGDLGLRQL